MVYDITPIIHEVPNINAIDITVPPFNAKRNPHREFPIEREERKRQRRGAITILDSDSEPDENDIAKDESALVREE